MGERVDFSLNASVYDRRHGALLPPDGAARLADAAALGSGSLILDVGAGTGRVAIALAGLGCRVVALDPARPMLQELKRKEASPSVPPVAGEGARLPFGASCFDAVVIARLLYLTADWRDVLRDAIRVLRPGGRLLHEWANGSADEEWVQIREQARTLFEHAGMAWPFHHGARRESEVDECLSTEGWTPSAKVSLGPGPVSTVAVFLARIFDGECTYTWNVPAEILDRCLPELRAWAGERFDLTRPIPMPRELSWRVYVNR